MKVNVGVAAGLLLALVALLMSPPTADAVHPKPGEYGARGVQFNPAMAGIPMLDYFTGSPIRPSGPAVGGRYQSLPPFGTRASCNVCHFDIVANENMNRHATMSFNKIPLPQYGVGYNKELPWMSGPGKFGKWSPAYNRQLGNMNATYSSQADLLKKLDMGAFEFTTECGVCHVGGGPGSSNPYNFTFPWRVSNYYGQDRGPGGIHSSLDNEQRNQSIANDFIFPLLASSPFYPLRVPLNPWDYFVNEREVKKVDWAQWGMNGTLQLDCLMCHLQGYDHLARNEQIVRYSRLYNAGTMGSGLAVVDPLAGEGFSMDYDASKLNLGSDGNLYLGSAIMDRIARFPKAGNCVHCHMPTAVKNQAGVEWKKRFYSYDAIPSDNPADPGNIKPARYLSDMVKRGDIWNSSDVHYAQDCGGCHSNTGKFQAWKPSDPKYMHSPGKGHDVMNTGSDEFGGTVKFCYDCHLLLGDLNGDSVQDIDINGAPSPTAAHARAGLLVNIVPKARRIDAQGAEAEFTGNHLDVISCNACHIEKRYAAARSIDFSTGSQFFNFVGNALDQESGPATVDLAYTWKETTPVRLLPDGKPNPLWRRLIYPFNYVTGIYWNNTGSKDANGDGFTTGMSNNGKLVAADPFFQRNVKENFSYGVNPDNNRIPVGLLNSTVFDAQTVKNLDGGVVFTRAAEIEAYRAQVTAQDPGLVPQLVLESEPYLIMHNVAGTAQFVLGKTTTDSAGKKVYGCSDCHGAAAGIYNGKINMIGKGKRPDNTETPLSVSWNSASHVSTKALYWDKSGIKQTASFSDLTTAPKKTREPNRWEFLGYDLPKVSSLDNILAPAAYGLDIDPRAIINAAPDDDATTLGLQWQVQVDHDIAAAFAQPNLAGTADVGIVSYAWSSEDAGAVIASPAARTTRIRFASTGDKIIALTVTDEEGKTSIVSLAVKAVVAPITIGWTAATKTATFNNLPSDTDSVKVSWGDGLMSTKSLTLGTTSTTLTHTYASQTTSRTIKVYCYNGTTQVGYMQTAIVPNTNK